LTDLTNAASQCNGQAWTGIRLYDEASGVYEWRLEGANGETVNEDLVNTLFDPTVYDPNELSASAGDCLRLYTPENAVRDRACSYSFCPLCVTSATAACVDTMVVYEQMHAEGAEGVQGYNDIDSCNALCLSEEDCVAVDYDLGDNPYGGMRCWLHMGSVGGELNPNPTVNHYVKSTPEC